MEWLKAIRGKISQREVAENAGITQAFYCEIEKGKKKPSVDVAKRIAEVLGFEWTKFFE
ncbi:MAG: helix-turn-helix domain-containing protein [Oscillospiraceae bacterium]